MRFMRRHPPHHLSPARANHPAGLDPEACRGRLKSPQQRSGRDGPNLLGGGSTHAWCQIYIPGSGWVEFDPTNGIVGNRDLIRVAVARVPSQAIPLFGTYWGDREDQLEMSGGQRQNGFGSFVAIAQQISWNQSIVSGLEFASTPSA
jgi:transglutaminase-like putative cysteine protease